jgi:hypothetical protein
MRSATCVIGVALLVLAARPAVAFADEAGPSSYRAVIDRVDLEPASIGGLRLRVRLSALALQGQLLDLSDPKSIKVMVGGTRLDAPYARGFYGATSSDTAIAFVIQINLAYAEVLQTIVSSLNDTVLSKLNERVQVAILAYGETTEAGKLLSLKAARNKLAQIAQDGSVGEPALLDTLDRAMRLLKKAQTTPEGAPLRKIIVVIGDGRDRSGDRERVTQFGVRADREGVRIHTLGFAPSNVRRPLLTLGELSKRSLGTFRWVRSGGAESWTPAFQQLRDEINKQYVLTYFLPQDSDIAGKELRIITVGRTEATSNKLKISEAKCGREPCEGYCVDGTCAIPREVTRRGVFGWLFLLIGIGLAVIVVLGVIGFVLQKRQHTPALPGQLPDPASPGQFPVPGQALVPGQAPAPGQFPALAAPGQVPAPGQFPVAGQAPVPGAFPFPGKPSKPLKSKGKPPKNQPQPIAALVPATGPVLLVMSGPRTGERIPLYNGFTIGKAPTSSLVIADGYASTQHAHVVMDQAGNCRLYDRNSTNGTFVNGVRITDAVLNHGMSIRIGSTELRFLAQ